MNCPHCKKKITFEEIISNWNKSWIQQSWIGFSCQSCSEYCHALVENGKISIGIIDGAPGPCLFSTDSEEIPSLLVKKEKTKISLSWSGGKKSR